MKRNFAVKAMAVMATVALAMAATTSAYAQDTTDELDDCWQPAFTVTADKAAYGANDQITLTATALNDLDAYESASGHEAESADDFQADMDIRLQIPDGYQVVSGSSTTTANDVAAGSSATAQVTIAKSSGTSSAASSNTNTSTNAKTAASASSTSKTGDPLFMALAAVCILAVMALLIFAVSRKRIAKDISNRMFCSLLALALVVGLSPFAAPAAYADDAADDENSEGYDDCDEHDAAGSVTFTVDGKSVTVDATVAVTITEEVFGYEPGSEEEDDPVVDDAQDPLLHATITNVNIVQGTADYTVTMRVEPAIFSGTGKLDLTKAAVTIDDTGISGGTTAAYAGSVAVLDSSTLQVVRTFTTEEVQQVVPEGESVQATLLPLAVYDFAQHKIVIGEGALTNSKGETMPAASMYPVIGVDLDNVNAAAASSGAQTQSASTEVASNTLAENDETLEISSASLEAGQEMLDAIGEFAEGVDGHSGELFMGAGSILGLTSKIIEAVDDSEADLYDIADVIDRLDTISSSIDRLSTQVSSIDEHLSAIEKKAEYQNNVDTVAALVSRANSYKKNLMLYADLLNKKTSTKGVDTSTYTAISKQLPEAVRNSYKAIRYSYDTLSANDKKMLTQFAKVTETSDATMGKDSVIGLAQDLANYVTAQGGMELYDASNIYQCYFNYTGTYFNWDSETYDMRRAFVGQYNLAFAFAYATAMNELNVEIATSSDPVVIVADMSLRDDLMSSATEMRDICKSNDVQSCMKARDDGKVLNLVNGKLFSKGFNVCHFSAYHDLSDIRKEWAAGIPDIQFIAKDNSIDSTPLLDSSYTSQLASDISVADFTTMFSNLTAVKQLDGYSSVQSLADEMEKMGLLDGSASFEEYGKTNYLGMYWDVYWQSNIVENKTTRKLDQGINSSDMMSSSHLQIRNIKGSSTNFYISTNTNPTKIKSKAGWEYIYDYTGTVVDISATSASSLVKQDVVLYELDHFKKIGHKKWYMQVNFYPAAVAKAS